MGRTAQTTVTTARDIAALPVGVHGFGHGLQLRVTSAGSRSWRVRVVQGGVDLTQTLGPFPTLSLADARKLALRTSNELRRGENPVAEARKARATSKGKTGSDVDDSFGRWAGDFLKASAADWSAGYHQDCTSRLDRYLRPTPVWAKDIDAVTPTELSEVLESVYRQRPDTGSKVKVLVSNVFRFARSKGKVALVNFVPDLKLGSGRRGKRTVEKHLPTITDIERLRDICRATESAKISPITRDALFLMSRTAQRASTVCGAKWSYIDLDKGLWATPRSEMKVASPDRPDHIIPLAPVVVERLRRLKKLRLHSTWVFPNNSSLSHLAIETPSKFYRRGLDLADQFVPHSWRSAFKSLAHEAVDEDGRKRFNDDDIDAITDHVIGSKVSRAYRRTVSLPRMKDILVWWAEQLEDSQ